MRTTIILLLLLIIPLPLHANEVPLTILYFENEHAEPLKYHFTVNDELYYETDDDGYYIFNNTVNQIEVDGQVIPIKVGHKHIIHVEEPVDDALEEVPHPHDETDQLSTTVKVFTPAFTPSEAVHVYLNEGQTRIATSEAQDGVAHFDNLKRDTVYTATTDEAVEPIRIKQGETRRITVNTDDPAPKVRAARVMPQRVPEKQKLNVKLNNESDEEESNKEESYKEESNDEPLNEAEQSKKEKQKKYTYTKRTIPLQESNDKKQQEVMPQIPVTPIEDNQKNSYNTTEQYDTAPQYESHIQKAQDKEETAAPETTYMLPQDDAELEYKEEQAVDKTLPDTGDASTNPLLLSVLFTVYGGCILYISRLI
ncbi:MAG: hypothetical protein UH078_03030 [Macrococcus canis]|uniref:hypothetical protein n=1 Tax=Macrococcoides canis TaxID=1855823 RepID=UPI002E797B89|nr:hypothetical protein [Macrococcus canis]MEE1106937.1 hypothetical protein [Macrococcus canis]